MIRSPLFNDVLTLRNNVEQLANEVFGADPFRTVWSRGSNGGGVAQPMPLDVYATDDHAVIIAAIPGMQPDDLELTVQENTVTLSGTTRGVIDSDDAKNATWYLHELGSGACRRSVTLPFPVDADRAEATIEHGIVRVMVPKAATAKPRRIAVSAGDSHQAIEGGASGSDS